jgi:hypothetical protein
MLAAVALLYSASNALPTNQQLTFNNVQGSALLLCGYRYAHNPLRPTWYYQEYSFTSEDGKFMVNKSFEAFSYNIQGVVDGLVPKENSAGTESGPLVYLQRKTDSSIEIEYKMKWTTRGLTHALIGSCSRANEGETKNFTGLHFDTVTLTKQTSSMLNPTLAVALHSK